MSTENFHKSPFDEVTLAKLKIFELYAQEWLPVFLARENPAFRVLHIYDFFAGAGSDSLGNLGSPLRMLQQMIKYRNLPGWKNSKIYVHFYDKSVEKIAALREAIKSFQTEIPDVIFDVKALDFSTAFDNASLHLADPSAAKLILLDQFGVDFIQPEIFNKLVSFPNCDFLFFIASSIFHRFNGHQAIKQKVRKADDYYSCHRMVFEFYRDLIPLGKTYFLAPFSLKKGSNIYGIIFGSSHPLGMAKFLKVAWTMDTDYGEANFDIYRQGTGSGQMLLEMYDENPIKKLADFESILEDSIRNKEPKDELDVIKLCFNYGMRPGHAKGVLAKLKKSGLVNFEFMVPDVKRWKSPRLINYR